MTTPNELLMHRLEYHYSRITGVFDRSIGQPPNWYIIRIAGET